MKFTEVKIGDRINYDPITVTEHEPLRNAKIVMLEGRGNTFNQPMVVCEGTDNGWMPLRECSSP